MISWDRRTVARKVDVSAYGAVLNSYYPPSCKRSACRFSAEKLFRLSKEGRGQRHVCNAAVCR
jgi:hypothetical protein